MTASAPSTSPFGSFPADLGRFSWNMSRGTTVWSNSVYRLHGYRPGQIIPSPAVAFGHKHPEDLHGCVDAIHAAMHVGGLVIHEHRLVDAGGNVQPVVMVARPVSSGAAHVRQLSGLLLPLHVDLGGSVRGAGPLAAVLMDVFGVSELAAHVLLAARRPLNAWRSPEQQTFAQTYTGPADTMRRTLEDTMFPLEHLTPRTVEVAA